MARHQDLTINHRLESWVYANAAARTAATGFVSGDVGRIAYQSDTGEYWRLTATTPTWVLININGLPPGGGAGAVLAKNSAANYDTFWFSPNSSGFQAGNSSTASTTLVMMGYALSLTPRKSGNVLILFNATVSNNTAGAYCNNGARYGTGTAPAAAAAATGTAVGNPIAGYSSGANYYFNGSFAILATGLTIGTPYWFDIARSVNSGTGTWSLPFLQVIEL